MLLVFIGLEFGKLWAERHGFSFNDAAFSGKTAPGEILPNALPPVIVYASVVMAVAILLESSLAFLVIRALTPAEQDDAALRAVATLTPHKSISAGGTLDRPHRFPLGQIRLALTRMRRALRWLAVLRSGAA